jgi:hypothetical protein
MKARDPETMAWCPAWKRSRGHYWFVVGIILVSTKEGYIKVRCRDCGVIGALLDARTEDLIRAGKEWDRTRAARTPFRPYALAERVEWVDEVNGISSIVLPDVHVLPDLN